MLVADVAGRYTDLVTTVFSSTLAMKAWFATAAAALALVQVTDREGKDTHGRLHFLPGGSGDRHAAPIAGRGGSRSCARCPSSSTA